MKLNCTIADLQFSDIQKENFVTNQLKAAEKGYGVVVYAHKCGLVGFSAVVEPSRFHLCGMDYNYNTGEYHECEHMDYLLIESIPFVASA